MAIQRSFTARLTVILLIAWNNSLTEAVIGWEYAVIIDAGSTGSRAHVFKYYRHKNFPYATIELPDEVHKTTPGLSSYAHDPKTGANSLQPLVKFAKQQVPEDQWPRTPLHLMATAGLRMLHEDTAAQIMEEARRTLRGGPFMFRDDWARIITGQQEGMFGWVSINYATGALQSLAQQQQQAVLGRKELPGGLDPIRPTAPLLGVLELGGGSLQITFAVEKGRRIPSNQAVPLEVPGLDGRQLYSRSFDGVGLQAAMAKHEQALTSSGAKADPCLPSGFRSESNGLVGGGDWEACKAAAKKLLPSERCTFSSCSLGNVFTPPVEGPMIGVDNFYYSARALQLKPGQVKLTDYESAAKRFCGKSWETIRKEYLKHSSGSDTYTLQVCFAAAHALSLLGDAFKLGNTTGAVTLSNTVSTPKGGTFSTSWTLGALLVEVLQVGGGSSSGDGGGGAGSGAKTAGGEKQKEQQQKEQQQQQRGHQQQTHLLPRAPQTDGGAAALAAAFCLSAIAGMALLSKMRVGVIPGPDRALEKGRSGLPSDVELQGLLSTNVVADGRAERLAGDRGGGAVVGAGGAMQNGPGGGSSRRRPGDAP